MKRLVLLGLCILLILPGVYGNGQGLIRTEDIPSEWEHLGNTKPTIIKIWFAMTDPTDWYKATINGKTAYIGIQKGVDIILREDKSVSSWDDSQDTAKTNPGEYSETVLFDDKGEEIGMVDIIDDSGRVIKPPEYVFDDVSSGWEGYGHKAGDEVKLSEAHPGYAPSRTGADVVSDTRTAELTQEEQLRLAVGSGFLSFEQYEAQVKPGATEADYGEYAKNFRKSEILFNIVTDLGQDVQIEFRGDTLAQEEDGQPKPGGFYYGSEFIITKPDGEEIKILAADLQSGFAADQNTQQILQSKGTVIKPEEAPAPETLEVKDRGASGISRIFGEKLFQAGDYDGALQQFLNAVDQDPYSQQAHKDLYQTYYKLGKVAEGDTAFDRMVEIFGLSPSTPVNAQIFQEKNAARQEATGAPSIPTEDNIIHSTNPEQLREFSQKIPEDDIILLTQLLQNPNTPGDVLKKYSTHSDWRVREWVVKHPNTAFDVLYGMRLDENPNVQSSHSIRVTKMQQEGRERLKQESLEKGYAMEILGVDAGATHYVLGEEVNYEQYSTFENVIKQYGLDAARNSASGEKLGTDCSDCWYIRDAQNKWHKFDGTREQPVSSQEAIETSYQRLTAAGPPPPATELQEDQIVVKLQSGEGYYQALSRTALSQDQWDNLLVRLPKNYPDHPELAGKFKRIGDLTEWEVGHLDVGAEIIPARAVPAGLVVAVSPPPAAEYPLQTGLQATEINRPNIGGGHYIKNGNLYDIKGNWIGDVNVLPDGSWEIRDNYNTVGVLKSDGSFIPASDSELKGDSAAKQNSMSLMSQLNNPRGIYQLPDGSFIDGEGVFNANGEKIGAVTYQGEGGFTLSMNDGGTPTYEQKDITAVSQRPSSGQPSRPKLAAGQPTTPEVPDSLASKENPQWDDELKIWTIPGTIMIYNEEGSLVTSDAFRPAEVDSAFTYNTQRKLWYDPQDNTKGYNNQGELVRYTSPSDQVITRNQGETAEAFASRVTAAGGTVEPGPSPADAAPQGAATGYSSGASDEILLEEGSNVPNILNPNVRLRFSSENGWEWAFVGEEEWYSPDAPPSSTIESWGWSEPLTKRRELISSLQGKTLEEGNEAIIGFVKDNAGTSLKIKGKKTHTHTILNGVDLGAYSTAFSENTKGNLVASEPTVEPPPEPSQVQPPTMPVTITDSAGSIWTKNPDGTYTYTDSGGTVTARYENGRLVEESATGSLGNGKDFVYEVSEESVSEIQDLQIPGAPEPPPPAGPEAPPIVTLSTSQVTLANTYNQIEGNEQYRVRFKTFLMEKEGLTLEQATAVLQDPNKIAGYQQKIGLTGTSLDGKIGSGTAAAADDAPYTPIGATKRINSLTTDAETEVQAGDYEAAFEGYSQAAEVAEASGKPDSEVAQLNSQAGHMAMKQGEKLKADGDTEGAQNQFLEAHLYYLKAQVNTPATDNAQQAVRHRDMGLANFEAGEYEKASTELLAAAQAAETAGNKEETALAYSWLGKAAVASGNSEDAIDYFEKAGNNAPTSQLKKKYYGMAVTMTTALGNPEATARLQGKIAIIDAPPAPVSPTIIKLPDGSYFDVEENTYYTQDGGHSGSAYDIIRVQSPEVRKQVAANPQAAKSIQLSLADDRNTEVRTALAKTTSDPDVQTKLSKDIDEEIRKALAGNENLDSNLLAAMAKEDIDPQTQAAARATLQKQAEGGVTGAQELLNALPPVPGAPEPPAPTFPARLEMTGVNTGAYWVLKDESKGIYEQIDSEGRLTGTLGTYDKGKDMIDVTEIGQGAIQLALQEWSVSPREASDGPPLSTAPPALVLPTETSPLKIDNNQFYMDDNGRLKVKHPHGGITEVAYENGQFVYRGGLVHTPLSEEAVTKLRSDMYRIMTQIEYGFVGATEQTDASGTYSYSKIDNTLTINPDKSFTIERKSYSSSLYTITIDRYGNPILEINEALGTLSGTYSQNELHVDELYKFGFLSEEQFDEINGWAGYGEENMQYVLDAVKLNQEIAGTSWGSLSKDQRSHFKSEEDFNKVKRSFNPVTPLLTYPQQKTAALQAYQADPTQENLEIYAEDFYEDVIEDSDTLYTYFDMDGDGNFDIRYDELMGVYSEITGQKPDSAQIAAGQVDAQGNAIPAGPPGPPPPGAPPGPSVGTTYASAEELAKAGLKVGENKMPDGRIIIVSADREVTEIKAAPRPPAAVAPTLEDGKTYSDAELAELGLTKGGTKEKPDGSKIVVSADGTVTLIPAPPPPPPGPTSSRDLSDSWKNPITLDTGEIVQVEIGVHGGKYYRVDPTTGELTQLVDTNDQHRDLILKYEQGRPGGGSIQSGENTIIRSAADEKFRIVDKNNRMRPLAGTKGQLQIELQYQQEVGGDFYILRPETNGKYSDAELGLMGLTKGEMQDHDNNPATAEVAVNAINTLPDGSIVTVDITGKIVSVTGDVSGITLFRAENGEVYMQLPGEKGFRKAPPKLKEEYEGNKAAFKRAELSKARKAAREAEQERQRKLREAERKRWAAMVYKIINPGVGARAIGDWVEDMFKDNEGFLGDIAKFNRTRLLKSEVGREIFYAIEGYEKKLCEGKMSKHFISDYPGRFISGSPYPDMGAMMYINGKRVEYEADFTWSEAVQCKFNGEDPKWFLEPISPTQYKPLGYLYKLSWHIAESAPPNTLYTIKMYNSDPDNLNSNCKVNGNPVGEEILISPKYNASKTYAKNIADYKLAYYDRICIVFDSWKYDRQHTEYPPGCNQEIVKTETKAHGTVITSTAGTAGAAPGDITVGGSSGDVTGTGTGQQAPGQTNWFESGDI